MDIQSITPTMVKSTYSGKAHVCCCGCAGKHYEEGPMITKVLRTVQANEETAKFYKGVGGSHVSVEIGKRLYVAYLKDGGK